MRTLLSALGTLALLAGPAWADSSTTITRTTAKTYTGTVVEYVPSKTIVIRDPGQRLVTYTLAPGIAVPAEVQVGRTVSLSVEPTAEGMALVRNVTITSLGPDGQVRTTTTRSQEGLLSTAGTVVDFVPRKSIVLRDADNRLVTYTLSPEVAIPAEVQVGRTVSVEYQPTEMGEPSVRRVTTVAPTADGGTRTTTRTTEVAADGTTTTSEETTVSGVVSAYTAARSVTIQRPDGSQVSYSIEPGAAIPADLVVGKQVMLRVAPGGGERVVRTITYTTTTTTTTRD